MLQCVTCEWNETKKKKCAKCDWTSLTVILHVKGHCGAIVFFLFLLFFVFVVYLFWLFSLLSRCFFLFFSFFAFVLDFVVNLNFYLAVWFMYSWLRRSVRSMSSSSLSLSSFSMALRFNTVWFHVRLNISLQMRAMSESTNDASLKSKFAALECECTVDAKPAANERTKSKWTHSHRWWLNRLHKSRWRQPQTIYFALYTYQPEFGFTFYKNFFLLSFAVFIKFFSSWFHFTSLLFFFTLELTFVSFVLFSLEPKQKQRKGLDSFPFFLETELPMCLHFFRKKINFLFIAHPVAFRSRRRLSLFLTLTHTQR